MKSLKKIVRTDAAFEILDNSNCAGTDWGSGGCAILAQALNKIEGYPIVVIYNLDYEGPEHFGVITPSGTILDHDGEHKNSKSWLRFFIENEHYRSGALTFEYYTPDMNMDGIKFDSEASDKLAELIKNYNMIRETVRSVFREDFIISESNLRIDEALSFINISFLNESDEPSPTFEWDIIKDKIDDSKRYVRTKEQAYEYLIRFLDKVKALPKSIKIRIVKYVALSLVGILGYSTIKDAVYEKAPEVADTFKKEVVVKKEIAPRASSDKLMQMLKQEEGSIQEKGEPVLDAYKLGDGMITVGWGHAERIGDSQFAPGQKITREKAEQLLASDVADAENGLNQILDDWQREGIKVKITQPMYDAMTSMIFNMGIGNFRKSDFIQLVKQGKYDEAAERILTTNVTYPGHVIRRQRESNLFLKGAKNNNMIAQLRENSIKEVALREKDLPYSTALFIREINQGYDLVLYDPKANRVYGTITVAQRDHYGPNYFVTGVAAERGFGPFIYELAMMHLSKLGRGLMPTRDGDVRDVAFSVWKQFFNRPDVNKEIMTIDNPYYRFDILGFSKDEFDSEEEVEEMLSELEDYQIEALKVFNTSYSMNTDTQYNQLLNKAKEYSNSGFDSQIAIDRADEFWNDAYMS
jgi:lysozyme